MNKLFLIVLLAVCLVSVHAFVKRDAPAAPASENSLDAAKKQLEDFFKANLDPEVLKQKISEFASQVNVAVDKLQEQLKPKANPQ